MADPTPTARAFGRSLADFEPLSAAETKLIACARNGEWCTLDLKRPEKPTKANTISAGLIRFLALGGDEENPVHERGLQLWGAWIRDTLDLSAVIATRRLFIARTYFAEPIFALDAHLPTLNLKGSQIPGFAADRCRISGSVNLCDGFKATGAVRLHGAQIGGSLECDGGCFENGGGDALKVQGATVKGGFVFRDVTIVDGSVDVTASHVGSLVDDTASWPKDTLILDGFTYDRISGGPTDAATRVAWLNKQISDHRNADFRPQPWEQLIKVLREMGHGRDADEVAIAKQHALRAAKKIGTRAARTDFRYGWRRWLDRLWNDTSNFAARRFHDIYGLLAGYGYRPVRILLWVMGLWLASGLAFHEAAMMGKMAPSNPILYAHEAGADVDVTTCGVIGDVDYSHYWAHCAEMPAEYTTFSALGYAADMILPLVDLQQDTEWGPAVSNKQGPLFWGTATRWLGWFDILFGWFASLMFVAIVGRLVERD